jgi:phosphoribosylanthranilate isomerase
MIRVRAKICGLSTPDAVQAAIDGEASHIGFVFFARSPRNINPELAAALAAPAKARGVKVVAVTVDAPDAELDRISAALAPDLIQLHGHETPERAAEIGRRTGAGLIRAFRVETAADLDGAQAFEGAVDAFLFDAKAPAGAVLPGGNGAAFDWTILADRRFSTPWFLAGGLGVDNLAEATRASGARLVDVSSGVEKAPGVKETGLITAFLDAARRA